MKKSLIIALAFITLQIYAAELLLMEWNVENMFDTIKQTKKAETILTEEEFNNKTTMIAGVIKKHNPDIISFCEIENIETLEVIANKAGYPYFYLIEGNDPRGIDVGVMSIYEMKYETRKNMYTPYPGNTKYKFSRDCTIATFTDNDNNTIYLLTTHLKSKLGDPEKSLQKQIAQANGILDIVLELYNRQQNPYIIITGDLNTERHTPPLNQLEKAGLTIMNYKVKQKDLYTYVYRGVKKDIDYFILNKELYKALKKYEIKSDNNKFISKISDHFPVLLKLHY